MNHFEFYVLWTDKTWTVEGVDNVPKQNLNLQETIDLARTKIHEQFCKSKGFECVGTLYWRNNG